MPRKKMYIRWNVRDSTVGLEYSCHSTIQTLHYPTLSSFDREAWEYFIVKYRRENLLAHKQNSILIIRRIDHGIVLEVCATFSIDPSEYHSVSNTTRFTEGWNSEQPKTGCRAGRKIFQSIWWWCQQAICRESKWFGQLCEDACTN